MPFTVKTKIEGVKPLLAKLEGLKRSFQRTVIRKAVDAAGKVTLDAIKPLVPKDTQLLAKSMGRKVVAKAGRNTAVAIVGPRTGFKVVKTTQRTARSLIGAAINGKTGKVRKVILRPGGGRGPVGHNPTQYAHLAERGRRAVRPINKRALSSGTRAFASAGPAKGSRFMERGLAAAKGRIVPAMTAVIQAALARVRR